MKSGFRNLSARTVVEFVNSGFLTRNIRLNSDTFDFFETFLPEDTSPSSGIELQLLLWIKTLPYMCSVYETTTNICRCISSRLAMKIFTYLNCLIQANIYSNTQC